MRADAEQLTDLVEQMARCAAHLQEVEAEVGRRVERLHVTWRGDAATLQADAHGRWTHGSEATRHALTTLRSIAARAAGNYDSAANTNRGMW